MKMKKIVALAQVLAIVLVLCACGSSGDAGSIDENASSSDVDSNISSSESSTDSANYIENFSIEGKWKSVGDDGFGQAQPGAIVAFDGTNCNFFSPNDTYSFYEEDGEYKLECTSYMSTDTQTFGVEIIDENNVKITYGDTVTELRRTE